VNRLRTVRWVAASCGCLAIALASGKSLGAQVDHTTHCSVSSVRGTYVFRAAAFRTFQPTPQFSISAFSPVSLIGRYTFDGGGKVLRSLTVSFAGGIPFPVADSGTYQLNPNCSGSVSFPAQSETLSFNVIGSRSIVIVTTTPGESGVAALDKQEIEDCSAQDLRGAFIFKEDALGAGQDPFLNPPLLIGGFFPVSVAGTWTFDGKGGVSRDLPVVSFGGFNFGPYSDAGTYQVSSDCSASAYFPSDQEPFELNFIDSKTIAFEVLGPGREGVGTLVKQDID
jgi:hypothetical protein